MTVSGFIEQSHDASTIEELAGMFCDEIRELGYSHYICYRFDGLAPDTESPVGKACEVHYFHDFYSQYAEQDYLEYDPLFKLLCRARGPFTWKQVMQLPLTPRQRAIMEERMQAGMAAGVGVPLQSADPALVGLTVVAERENAPEDNSTLSQIFALSNQFQLQRARILGREQAFVLPHLHLTPREREMLEWAAQGKSNGVIASILGISEKTVEFHFKSIFTKLDVSSRTTAVLKAVHMRLINMDNWN